MSSATLRQEAIDGGALDRRADNYVGGWLASQSVYQGLVLPPLTYPVPTFPSLFLAPLRLLRRPSPPHQKSCPGGMLHPRVMAARETSRTSYDTPHRGAPHLHATSAKKNAGGSVPGPRTKTNDSKKTKEHIKVASAAFALKHHRDLLAAAESHLSQEQTSAVEMKEALLDGLRRHAEDAARTLRQRRWRKVVQLFVLLPVEPSMPPRGVGAPGRSRRRSRSPGTGGAGAAADRGGGGGGGWGKKRGAGPPAAAGGEMVSGVSTLVDLPLPNNGDYSRESVRRIRGGSCSLFCVSRVEHHRCLLLGCCSYHCSPLVTGDEREGVETKERCYNARASGYFVAPEEIKTCLAMMSGRVVVRAFLSRMLTRFLSPLSLSPSSPTCPRLLACPPPLHPFAEVPADVLMASLALLARLVTGVASCLGVSLPHPLYPAASTRYATISVDSSPRERCVHLLRHGRALSAVVFWGRWDFPRSMGFCEMLQGMGDKKVLACYRGSCGGFPTIDAKRCVLWVIDFKCRPGSIPAIHRLLLCGKARDPG